MKLESKNLFVGVSALAAANLLNSVSVFAQDVPLAHKASPEVYKVLDENDQFRIILQTSKPGQRDDWHSHPPLAGYRLTDCTSRLHLPDGKYMDTVRKQGETFLLPAVKSHSFENTGKPDCVAVIVERK